MVEENSSYKQILKATSIFGGVQIFNIIISVFRAKFIAVIIGPAGMGIFGLLTSTLSLITSLTSFGLSTSSVKDIAFAYERSDNEKVMEVTSILRNLVWYTGALGMILTLLLSPLLSKLTFDTYNYTWSFILLSVTLLLGQLTLGKDAVLQGTRKIKWLAYANMISSALSLIVTFPVYYFYGIKGIVPAIIIASCFTLIITQFYYSRLKFVIPFLKFRETWHKGKDMLKLGFFLSLSGIITTCCTYGVRIFISKFGGFEQLGFYNAGFGIINSYVGIIFTAMATDYYPRLAGSSNDKNKFSSIINEQGNVALIILGPILTGFVIFNNFAITLLYSKEFLPAQAMMQYAIIGVFVKAAAWLLGFLVVAKGETKIFFWSELIANTYHSIFNCIGFYYWGLEGLGISFIAGYSLHLLQMIYISKARYKFFFNNDFIKIFILQLLLALIAFLIMKSITNNILSYSLGSLIIVITSTYSIYELNKILNIKAFILKFIKKL